MVPQHRQMRSRLKPQGPLTVDGLCGIDRSFLAGTRFGEYAGVIRTQQNWLGGNYHNPCRTEYVPPVPEAVPALLDDLVAFCNSDALLPLAQAAVAHAQLEAIRRSQAATGASVARSSTSC